MAEQLHPVQLLLGMLGIRATSGKGEPADGSQSGGDQFSQLLMNLLPAGAVEPPVALTTALQSAPGPVPAVDPSSSTPAPPLGTVPGKPVVEQAMVDELPPPETGEQGADTMELAALLNLVASMQAAPAISMNEVIPARPALSAAPLLMPAVQNAPAAQPVTEPALQTLQVLVPVLPMRERGSVADGVVQQMPEQIVKETKPSADIQPLEGAARPAGRMETAREATPALHRSQAETESAPVSPEKLPAAEQSRVLHVEAFAKQAEQNVQAAGLPAPGPNARTEKAAAGDPPLPVKPQDVQSKAFPLAKDVTSPLKSAVYEALPREAGREKLERPAHVESKQSSAPEPAAVRQVENASPGRIIERLPLQTEIILPIDSAKRPAAERATNDSAPAARSDEAAPEQTVLPSGTAVSHSSAGSGTGDALAGKASMPLAQQPGSSRVGSHQPIEQNNAGTGLPPDLSRGVVDQVVKSLTLQVEGKSSEMRITLQPESLGEVKLHVRMEEGRMQAQIDVTQVAVKSALEASLPQLRQELAMRGIEVQRIDVFSPDQSFPRESTGGQGDKSKRHGGRRSAEVDAVEQYQASRSMGYNTMEIIM